MCAPTALEASSRRQQPDSDRSITALSVRSTTMSFQHFNAEIDPSPGYERHPPIDPTQWTYIESISPKFLREIQRQYDPNYKEESSQPFARGAAKIKTWVKKNKLGFDIRLRRKINNERDAVLDISLTPDYMKPSPPPSAHLIRTLHPLDGHGEQPQELPGDMARIIHMTGELPDDYSTPQIHEMPTVLEHRSPSRNARRSFGEPLPQYESPPSFPLVSPVGSARSASSLPGPSPLFGVSPGSAVSPLASLIQTGKSRPNSIELTLATQELSASSSRHNSASATPTLTQPPTLVTPHPTQTTAVEGLGELMRTDSTPKPDTDIHQEARSIEHEASTAAPETPKKTEDNEQPSQNTDHSGTTLAVGLTHDGSAETSSTDSSSEKDASILALQESLNQAQQKLLEQEQSSQRKLLEQEQITESFQTFLETLRQEAKQPDTSTKSGESSPVEGRILKEFKVANAQAYETETDLEPASSSTLLKQRPTGKGKRPVINPGRKRPKKPSTSSLRAEGQDLDRRSSILRATPSSAGIEAVWAAVLHLQEKMLNSEHQLVLQAKADLALSRKKGHKGGIVLDALFESEEVAKGLLGAHPYVATFSADLKTLSALINSETAQTLPSVELQTSPPSPSAMRNSVPASPVLARSTGAEPHPLASQVPQDHTSSLPLAESGILDRDPQTPVTGPDEGMPRPAFPATESIPSPGGVETHMPVDRMYDMYRAPHVPKSNASRFHGMLFNAVMRVATNGISWLQRNIGPEPEAAEGKVRVKWTCSCGEQLHDDFIERRPGAARELEAYLNRPMHIQAPQDNRPPSSPASSMHSMFNRGTSSSGHPSTQTSWSSHGFNSHGPHSARPHGATDTTHQFSPWEAYEPPWLLTCAHEDGPKMTHLDMSPGKIRSDRDLAESLRKHYSYVNEKWYRAFRLRGLSSIEFVQFEVHKNRFCDIRKVPDMPSAAEHNDYSFIPSDLLPPVGSTYLLHLFRHPQDYDNELITYLRAPKRNNKLSLGRGWGINLVEDFDASKIWWLVFTMFVLGSLSFGIAWKMFSQDVKGAFGVSTYILSAATLLIWWFQAAFG